MAFDPNDLNTENTPARWRIQGKRLAEGGAEGAAEAAKLDSVYEAVLTKAATFTSDGEMGVGNQPNVGSEPDPDPILVTGITLTGAESTYEFDDFNAANNDLNFGATVLPVNADDTSFTFTTSDAGVIAITETYGLVELIAAGVATITVTANDGSGASDSKLITVTNNVTETE